MTTKAPGLEKVHEIAKALETSVSSLMHGFDEEEGRFSSFARRELEEAIDTSAAMIALWKNKLLSLESLPRIDRPTSFERDRDRLVSFISKNEENIQTLVTSLKEMDARLEAVTKSISNPVSRPSPNEALAALGAAYGLDTWDKLVRKMPAESEDPVIANLNRLPPDQRKAIGKIIEQMLPPAAAKGETG